MSDEYDEPRDTRLESLWPTAIERALLGALLMSPTSIDQVASTLLPGDFCQPDHQAIFGAMVGAWERGEPVDYVVVADEAKVPVAHLSAMWADVPSVSGIPKYAEKIVSAGRLRRIAVQVANLNGDLMSGTIDDPDRAAALALQISEDDGDDFRATSGPLSMPMFEFMQQVEDEPEKHEWIIPDMLRRRWRIIVAGEEGIGKMVLLRQIGHSLAAGRHPWNPAKRITPARVLFVDLENPQHVIWDQTRLIHQTNDLVAEAGERLHIHSNEAGMDVSEPGDRRKFERIVAEFRPDVLVCGPMYKLSRRKAGGSDWDADAMSVITFLDSIRTRYDCALLLETHLVKSGGNSYMRSPEHAGSAMFRRWPEAAFSMIEDTEATSAGGLVKLHRYRSMRSEDRWPQKLIRREGLSTANAWGAYFESGSSAY